MNTIPVMLYDGDCAFCQRWIEKWHRMTGYRISYEPYQKVITGYPQVTAEQCREAVQLILPDGAVFSGAHAVLKALALSNRFQGVLRIYEIFPWFARLSEWSYQRVATHRSFLSRFFQLPQCPR